MPLFRVLLDFLCDGSPHLLSASLYWTLLAAAFQSVLSLVPRFSCLVLANAFLLFTVILPVANHKAICGPYFVLWICNAVLFATLFGKYMDSENDDARRP